MRPKRSLSTCLLVVPILAPATASALFVDIQGTRLQAQLEGGSCVEIAGDYPSVRIETSEAGKTPRICYNSAKVNSISILNCTFVATTPVRKDISIKFEHEFPTGINGKVMARAKLQGFFSTANGVGIPTGDKIGITGFFSQTGHDEKIAEPLDVTVGDQMDSALFEYSVKEQYLMAGSRTLKGALKIVFTAPGRKLTLQDKNAVSIDTGSTFEDKLDTLDVAGDDESTTPAEGIPPGDGLPLPNEAPKAGTPPDVSIPLPPPPGGAPLVP